MGNYLMGSRLNNLRLTENKTNEKQGTEVMARKKYSVADIDADSVLTTEEACEYLRISRPTYLKYLWEDRIHAVKAGKGWKVLKSELYRFLKGG
jgi:excisionase family DNA binding protein